MNKFASINKLHVLSYDLFSRTFMKAVMTNVFI